MKYKALPFDVPPGERIVYYIGYLMRDRMNDIAALDAQLWAWNLYQKGRVILVQHRLAEEEYEYIAIGRKPYR